MSDLVRARIRGLARNRGAPADVQVCLLEHADWTWDTLLFRPDLPHEVYDAAVTHPDRRVRCLLAESWGAPPTQRARLVDDASGQVRATLAWGPHPFRQQVEPLATWVYERLAADLETAVRKDVAACQQVPDHVRLGLVDDPDPDVRATAYSRLRNPPESVTERLLTDPDAGVRRAVALCAYRQRPDLVPTVLADPALSEWDLARIAADAPLDREQAEWLASHDSETVRAGVAENPHLPADLARKLAVDPVHRVRLAASMRPELSESERATIDYHIAPSDRLQPARWVDQRLDDLDVLRRCVTSAHIGLRRSAAYSPHLTADLVALLADDDDFAVRLLLCENHPDVPSDLLLSTFLEAQVITRTDLLHRPNFPRAGLARLADSANPDARVLVTYDPAASPALIEQLSHDQDRTVRRWMADDRRLVPGRILELLADPDTAEAAAANPSLPAEEMKRILADAGFHVRATPGPQ